MPYGGANQPGRIRRGLAISGVSVTAILLTGTVLAEAVPSFNLYGLPGLVDMPTAEMAPDGTLGFTYGRIGDSHRGTMMFQITPKLIGAFRYSGIDQYTGLGEVGGVYYDRSFDLRYQLWNEGAIRPAVAVGLQDFIGTGAYSAEYVVATKTIAPGLKVTGGLGWGRLATHNPVATFGARPSSGRATSSTRRIPPAARCPTTTGSAAMSRPLPGSAMRRTTA